MKDDRGLSESEARQKRCHDPALRQRAHVYPERIVDCVFGGMDLAGLRVFDAMCSGGQNAAFFAARAADARP